uniref:phosphatidylinositol-3,5-bisphosphate 3-phosphatase n=1 Tax=Oncorhynchus kisutch TaxID=8019 RepID=A0A8C7MWH8_ONCKI
SPLALALSLSLLSLSSLSPPRSLSLPLVPFPALQGEGVEYLGRADDAVIAISNYRLHIKFKDSVINVPLMLIESVESRHMFQLHITCKDSKVVRCHFSTFKQCQEWLRRLNRTIAHPGRLEDLFALAYHAWCLGSSTDDEDQHLHLCRPGDHVRQRLQMEVKRMGFDMQNAWRVSDINLKYKLCSSYPQQLLVPVWITDKELESVGSFRSSNRIPVVVYRHQRNGAVIARCSQPEISWWGWRNTEDEYLVTSIAKACLMDPGTRFTCEALACSQPRGEGPDSSDSDFDSSLTGCPGPDANTAPQKLLILDARSYTAAVANRAKGGGCECEEYYPNCEVMFMGMANIHSIRNSFQSLRAVCSQIPDPGNWLSALESTRWLQHLSVMLKAATLVCSAVEREGRPVLVHCSDGWDRTPQIVALAKILLDPFYRTLEGFQVLVETEWLDYGHKFGDRCGHQEDAVDVSEQCPVFLQWLDCVHQLFKQFPCLFEFNEAFLVKLVQHTYSCLYGTFLCNNGREREVRNIHNRTCSVWSLLRSGNKNFQNFLFIPGHDMVLQPVCHTRALQLWTAVYLPTSSPCTSAEDAMELYLSPSVQGDELTSRSLDRWAYPLTLFFSLSTHSILLSVHSLYSSLSILLSLSTHSVLLSVYSLYSSLSSGSSWLSAVRSSSGYAAIMGPTTTSSPPTFSTCQLLPASPCSSASPQPHPAYLDDDGLPVPVDAVQQRLRQMEAGYKQEVEVLRSQVRQLQMRLERKQYSTPPSEPDVDYEDDIVNDSDEEDSLSDHSEDRFSEGSWDRVEQKDTEVTRWVPDHMASHCFNCDCEFWMAKRRHHCRNCGNVFCKDCCHLKLPIPDQQLYDPVLVCNVCCDLLLEARNREIRSQQLKKPIATASS